jgi:hypothetical protein
LKTIANDSPSGQRLVAQFALTDMEILLHLKSLGGWRFARAKLWTLAT